MEYIFTLKYQLSEQVALVSALSDVKSAIPSVRLIEARLISWGSAMLRKAEVSRQSMRKLMVSHLTAFPAPVHEGSSSVWHLAEVMMLFFH